MSANKSISDSLLLQIPVFIISVISGIFVTRILGPEGKGFFSLLTSDIQLFSLIFSFSMNVGIVHFLSNKVIEPGKLIGFGCLFIVAGFILLSLLLLLIHNLGMDRLIFSNENAGFYYYFYLLSSFILTLINTIFSSVFQGNKEFKIINRISLAMAILQLAVFVILYSGKLYGAWNINLREITIASLILLFLNGILWSFFYLRKLNYKIDLRFDYKSFTVFLSYSVLIYTGTIINYMNYRLDLWVVNYYLPSSDLGIYALTGNILQLFITIAVVVSSVLLPYLSSLKLMNEKVLLFRNAARMSFLLMLILVSFTALVAPFLVPIVYGNEFEDSVLPLLIILPGIVLSTSTQLFATLIVSCQKNILNIIATSVGLCVTLVLDLFLIPEFGIIGAAYATLFAYCTVFGVTFVLSVKKLGLPMQNYFIPSRNEIKKGIAGIFAYLKMK